MSGNLCMAELWCTSLNIFKAMLYTFIQCNHTQHCKQPNDGCVLVAVEVKVFVFSNACLISALENGVPTRAWTEFLVHRFVVLVPQSKHQSKLNYWYDDWNTYSSQGWDYCSGRAFHFAILMITVEGLDAVCQHDVLFFPTFLSHHHQLLHWREARHLLYLCPVYALAYQCIRFV